ncbi:MAG: pyridoxal phosphate-dependent aminotransferase [Bacteroidales bacterium]|nr:pyridoxal phosphate-dependent aminotransferase [Bacteroidales bacterium]
MFNTPVPPEIVKKGIQESGLEKVGRGSIREIVGLINNIEQASGIRFIRMEMGVPGLDAPGIGIEAEIEALKKGVASKYPMIDGVKELKNEISRFVKLFINLDVTPEHCIPSVGSMQGSMATFMVSCQRDVKKDTTLFIDPGFPVQKRQHHVLGLKYESFDVYNYRGEKLREKLESFLAKGNISTMVYSSPNNPSWICFSERELQIIGELATKYDTVVIEDLAYIAMDFRNDYGRPGEAPFQPTVARYTDNFVLLISSSKVFSYAGQRVAMIVISDSLYSREFPHLAGRFSTARFGYSIIQDAIYSLSAGVGHSAQYGLRAMLKAANDGTFNFLNDIKEYGEKAKIMKELFIKNGFKLVYDQDEDKPLADGFYFTIFYPGFSGLDLMEELLYYGISAITLDITGSKRSEGLRACVSQIKREQFNDLRQRLEAFRRNHS